jgi:hypothetical protein
MKKICKKYVCEKCDYTCSRKFLWLQHIKTIKHNGNKRKHLETKNMHNCLCGKIYKTRGGLHKHKSKCTFTVEEPKNTVETNDPKIAIILKTILQENRELRKEMKNLKINQSIFNTGTTNNNNQKYNINVFLNEHCKDAMCLEDFMNTIQLTLQDIAKTTQLGFAGGMSNILIKNLNDLPTINRPIHCSDPKRLKFYVKDRDGWNIDISNQKVDKVIEVVTMKQIKKIKDWENENPDFLSNDMKLKEWQIMLQNVAGPSDDGDREKKNKTIKRNVGGSTGIKEAMATVE